MRFAGCLRAFVDAGSKLIVENSTVASNDSNLGSGGASVSGRGGGIFLAEDGGAHGELLLVDSIIWDNIAGATPGSTPSERLDSQILIEAPIPMPAPIIVLMEDNNVEESNDPLAPLPDGWTVLGSRFDLDPHFTVVGSDFRLLSTSPSLDRAPSVEVGADPFDVDRDGDSSEVLPAMNGTTRIVGAQADQGAFEFGPDACPADLSDDGEVGFADLLILLNDWGLDCTPVWVCPSDPSGDLVVGFDDLLVILTEWGPCGAATGNPPQSITDCIERLGTSDPQTLAACIEAMMRLEEGN